MFEKSKEAARERKAAQEAQRAERAEAARVAALDHRRAVTEWCLDRAHEVESGIAGPAASIASKKDEHVLFVFEGAGLVEARRGAGHWQGGSQAVSVRVPGTKSMRYKVGGTRGTYVQGDESPTIIDNGVVTVTDQRAVFVGAKQTREWAWSKLVGFNDDDAVHWTGIAVSNRQKVSGISYPQEHAVTVRFYLEAAVAKVNGHLDEMIAELEESIAQIDAERASPASLPAEPTP